MGSGRRMAGTMLALLLGAAALPLAAAERLAICLARDHAPYSVESDDSGFDRALAEHVARSLDRDFVAVWYANATVIQEIEENDFPTRKLARGECDAIFSLPGPASTSLAGEDGLVLGEPYYGAGFELVSCGGEFPLRPAAWRGRRLAIQSQTVAHFAAQGVGAEVRNFFSPAAAIDGLAAGAADAALVWGPSAGWLLRERAGRGDSACRLAADYLPPAALRWNLHVATRAADTALRASIDGTLATLRTNGTLSRLATLYGVPPHAPFSDTYSQAALAALRGR